MSDGSGDSIRWRELHPRERAPATKMEFAKHEDAVRKVQEMNVNGYNAYIEQTKRGRYRVRLKGIVR